MVRIRKVCVWISRHTPTPEQLAALTGYDVIQLAAHQNKADHVRGMIARQLPRCDLVLATLPHGQLSRLARIMRPTPVIRAVMNYDDPLRPVWTGRFERICGMQLQTEEWNPEEG